MRKSCIALGIGLCLISQFADAKEYPIGGPIKTHHLEIASSYLLHIETSPSPQSMVMGNDIIHLETDVHALAGNPWGYEEGSWIPYLSVDYVVRKEGDSNYIQFGQLLPMSASDGPHYAHSVPMAGKGRYTVMLKYTAPDEVGYERHIDQATGIGPWFKPFVETFTFDYPQH
ncbi:34 kDa membrane antigen [Halomonadaceae bacterium LMG 33818]|uniref:iron transporter n=1 Tax=Cernens ardua TaxID=3402176 RepID=UPI003EDC55CE